MGARPSLISLSEQEREQALQRYQQLRPALEDGVSLTLIAAERGIPLRTAQRWVARYQTQGLAGLVRRRRADRGQHRRIAPNLQRLIEGLALKQPPPSVATIHRQILPIAVEQGWSLPSYASVYQIVKQLDPALLTLAHEGAKAYREAFDLLYRREASHANEIWQADHTPLDIWLVSDQGQPMRPWLTTVIDDYSRALAGYYLTFQPPSSIQTALAFRQAIWRKTEPQACFKRT